MQQFLLTVWRRARIQASFRSTAIKITYEEVRDYSGEDEGVFVIASSKVEQQFDLVKECYNRFSKTIPIELPALREVKHHMYPKPGSEWLPTWRPLAHMFKQQIDNKLNTEAESAHIYSASNNLNTVVMFWVAKRDQLDKSMFVTNYPVRNLAVYKKQTLLRNINELMELVAAYSVWSIIDWADADFNIRIVENSEKWKTIQTTCGKMTSQVMLQVDCNDPVAIIEAMVDIFTDVLYQYLVIYMDHIIIYYIMHEENVIDLNQALQRLEEQKFYLEGSKCQFVSRKLKILEHILTSDRLHVDHEKRKSRLVFTTPAW